MKTLWGCVLTIIFAISTPALSQQKFEGLKTIDDLFLLQMTPIREYFRDLPRIRMKIDKPNHNYWFNYGTMYTGGPFYRILIRREKKENYIREILEYYSKTMFSARLDYIREGTDLHETPDEQLLLGQFPIPSTETKYILASSILGFEIYVQNLGDKRTALFSFDNNSIKYSVEEQLTEDRELYKYTAHLHGKTVDIFPQIEVLKIHGQWEPRYSLSLVRRPLTAATYAKTFDGLFGFILQYGCLWQSKITEKDWPRNEDMTCNVTVSWPVPKQN